MLDFGLNVPNAGTVNSINFLEYLKTQGNGGISIIAGSGTGNTNALSSINVTNPGNGYTVVPTVTIDNTNSIGLPPSTQAYLGITNGSISLAPLNSASAGYTIGDVLELQDFQGSPRAPFNLLYPGTTGSNRFVVVTNVSPLTGQITQFEQSYNANSVLGVKVNTPGNGYTEARVAFGNDSTGSPSATGRVYLNVSSNAAPFAWTTTQPSMNATTATNQVVLVENATLSTSGTNNLIPGGTGYRVAEAVIQAVVSAGIVSGFNILYAGTGYTTATVPLTLTGGTTGTNALATANVINSANY